MTIAVLIIVYVVLGFLVNGYRDGRVYDESELTPPSVLSILLWPVLMRTLLVDAVTLRVRRMQKTHLDTAPPNGATLNEATLNEATLNEAALNEAALNEFRVKDAA